jgi:hypothetical protein
MSLLEGFFQNSTTPLSYIHLKKPGLKDCDTTSYAGRKLESLVICSNERSRSLYQDNPGGDNQWQSINSASWASWFPKTRIRSTDLRLHERSRRLSRLPEGVSWAIGKRTRSLMMRSSRSLWRVRLKSRYSKGSPFEFACIIRLAGEFQKSKANAARLTPKAQVGGMDRLVSTTWSQTILHHHLESSLI